MNESLPSERLLSCYLGFRHVALAVPSNDCLCLQLVSPLPPLGFLLRSLTP